MFEINRGLPANENRRNHSDQLQYLYRVIDIQPVREYARQDSGDTQLHLLAQQDPFQ